MDVVKKCSGGHRFNSCRGLRFFFCPKLESCWSIQLSQKLVYFKVICGAFSHFDKHEIATWRHLLSIKNEANWLVAMRSKELGLVQKNHATAKLESSFSWSESLQRKQNWTANSTMQEKSSQLTSSEHPRELKPGPCLEYCSNYTQKTSGCSQHWRQLDSRFGRKKCSWRWKFLASVVGDSQNNLHDVGDTF